MKSNYKAIGELVERIDERNRGGSITTLIGVSIDKKFIPSVANVVGTDLTNYKVIRKYDFAVSLMQVSRDEKIPVACQKEYNTAIMSPAYPIFRVKDTNIIMPEYLEMWFMRSEFDREASFVAVGGVRGSMPWEEFAKLKLPVPPLDEQIEIVQSYQAITDRIVLKKRINDNLTEQCGTDYIRMLNGYTTDSTDLPDGWSIGSIGNYCDVKSGYAFKSGWWTNNGYKVIKIANIVNNSIDLDSCDCVIAEHAVKANNFFVKSGDILIAMTGATTGKIGIVPLTNEPIVVNQRVGKFFLGENPIEKAPFLYSTLLYSRVVRHLQPDGTAGSAQDNLSADNIKDVAIVLPDNSLIDSFNKQHIPHLKMMMSNWAEIRSLNKMAETLLQTLSSR